jgi:hypothetical protein
VVCVFTRKIDGSLTSLVKQINEQVGKNEEKQLSAFVVLLTDDQDKVKTELEKFAEKEKIHNVPLTLVETPSGPPDYKIHKDAEVTVLLWNQQKVVANHAFKAGAMQKEQVATVMKDVAKMLEN